MPTNLPPEYFEVEERYKAATDPGERIELLEELISTIPKHKGTDKLRADLRRRLSKMKSSAQGQKSVSRHTSAFRIDKEGAGQVVLVGPANVGKSALVAALTNASPEVSPSPFSTWAPTPGMMPVKDIQVQLIDTPPLNQEFVDPEQIDLIRRADLVLLMVDLQAFPIEQLEGSLDLLAENRIYPRQWRGRYSEDRRARFKPMLVIANKCDDERCDEDFAVLKELLEEDWPMIPLSVTHSRNFEQFKGAVFDRLEVMRVYAKPPNQDPDFSAPFVIKQGSTVEEFAARVHKDFVENLKSARVWGSGVFEGQPVGRDHVLQDGDVVELRI